MSFTMVTVKRPLTQLALQQYRTRLTMASVVVGPPGPAGPGGGSLSVYTAALPISGHQAIALNSAGQAIYASANDLSHVFRVVGLSTGASVSGDPVSVQAREVLEFSGWSWTTGDKVLLGLNGALVANSPAVGSLFLQVLGKALAPTRILVGIQPPIIL